MAQLKQKLAAEGYDVTKNNRQVKAATKRLVNNEAFVRTTRSASLRLNKKVILFCRFSKMCTSSNPTLFVVPSFLTPDINRQKAS